jgi:Flp pilus assembly protein TadG
MTLDTTRPIRIVADRAGTAAVEFALIMPLFATLFFGTFEVATLLLADMKLTAAAQAAADLAARAPSSSGYLKISDFTDMTNAVSQVMTPLPTTTRLKIAYASVTYGTGTPVVAWHYETNGASAITMGTIPNGVDMTTLGSTASGSTDSVIVVRLQYAYTSPISYVLAKTWDLTESAFERPQ